MKQRDKERNVLLDSPRNYRRKKSLNDFFEVRIVGEWEAEGLAPWQAYLPVRYKGIDYTFYLRERHDNLSLKVMWGHEGVYKSASRELQGFVGFLNLLTEEDLKSDEDLYDIAERRGKEYLEDLKGLLPENTKELEG